MAEVGEGERGADLDELLFCQDCIDVVVGRHASVFCIGELK
jgi:hypothetical protein